MNLPEMSVRRGVTTLMIFLGGLIFGIFCLVQTPIDQFPEMEIPTITVSTPYPGAGPEDVEEKVTRTLERVLATIEDVEHIFSTSREGASNIRLTFTWGTNLDGRANDVRDAIDRVARLLPDDAESPRIFKFDISAFPIMVYGVRATDSYPNLERILDDNVATHLERIPGVASVTTMVPLNRQVNVDLDRELLASHGLTATDVVRAIAQENVDVSAGSIETGRTDYLPRVPGEFDAVEPMNHIVLTAHSDRIVRIKDVGRVTDGFEDTRVHVTVNGEPGGIFFVSKQADANTVNVARAVRARLPELERRLPADIQIINVMDGAEDIEMMVQALAETLLIGGVLAMFAVLIFLRQVRATFIIGLSIPFSLLLSAAAMYLLDYSVNMITLFAVIVTVGMVVDTAIVILENITRHRADGESPREGAVYGASEVGMAITASTLTTLCIFFPLLFVRGIARILFTPFAAVAGIVLIASLFSALTLTPMLASRLLPRRFLPAEQRRWFFRFSEKAFNGIENGYRAFLGLALNNRLVVVVLAILLFAGSLAMIPAIGWEFTPEEDQGYIQGTIELPIGTRLSATAEVMREINRIIEEVVPEEDRLSYFTRCGSAEGGGPMGDHGNHLGVFGVRVVSKENRDWSIFELGDRLRARIEELAGVYSIEDVSIILQDPMSQMIAGGEQPLTVNILGDDLEVTDRLARELKEMIEQIPGTVDVAVSREIGAPELWVRIDRDKASSMGLNVSQVADNVRTSIYGQTASFYRALGDEYDIFVRLRKEDRATPEDLGRLPIRLPDGRLIRAESIADITREAGPVEIERRDQVRVVRVEGNVRERSLGEVLRDVEAVMAGLDVPEGVDLVVGGMADEMRESFLWLTIALGLGIILVYMVMASQFESLVHPFVVMFSVPFAFVGVVGALFLGGFNLNIIVFIGMLLLIGVVVNNAIVLVDYINILHARGKPLREAIMEAGRVRLRPVLMTAFTTIFALLPMAVRTGQGDEMWNPLGATILGGLAVSTLVTLVIIPVIYSLVEGLRRKVRAGGTSS